MTILLTGRHGLFGRYLAPMLEDHDLISIGTDDRNDIRCDLMRSTPALPDDLKPDLVIHAAGTEDPEIAMDLNLEGTRRLLDALDRTPPRHLLFISCWSVYSPDAGLQADESTPTWAVGKVGQSKALAEAAIEKWCAAHPDTILTILRPATMFGNDMKGWATEMFNDVVSGRYIHVRGNDAAVSAVTAYDVARAAMTLYPKGGIYNISDGRDYTYTDLADAMSANAGAMKRMTHLPPKWAALAWKTARWIPAVERSLNPEVLDRRSRTLTLSNAKAMAAGCSFLDTGAVLRREIKIEP